MTDHICHDREEGFKPALPIFSSCQVNLPEISHGASTFSEWIVSLNDPPHVLQSLAHEIVDDIPSPRRLTRERVREHMTYRPENWAGSLFV